MHLNKANTLIFIVYVMYAIHIINIYDMAYYSDMQCYKSNTDEFNEKVKAINNEFKYIKIICRNENEKQFPNNEFIKKISMLKKDDNNILFFKSIHENYKMIYEFKFLQYDINMYLYYKYKLRLNLFIDNTFDNLTFYGYLKRGNINEIY